MKKSLRSVLFAALFCLLPGMAHAGTYTAATCNRSDVNAVINGPTHTAVDGDVIIIPTGTCTWTSGISVSAGIDITGQGTPNTGGGTFTAGTSTTNLNSDMHVPFFAFTLTSPTQIGRAELINAGVIEYSITAFSITSNVVTFTVNNNFTAGETIPVWGLSTGTYLNGFAFIVNSAGLSSTQFSANLINTHANVGLTSDSGNATRGVYPGPITALGTCTAGGCPQLRVDNISFVPNVWGITIFNGAFVLTDNVFGVLDHNTLNDNSWVATGGAGPPMLDMSNSAWQGIGTNGNYSFGAPDTFGTSQALYLENNTVTYLRMTDNDVTPVGGAYGGARIVCRFNQNPSINGSGVCGAHGTAWAGLRSIRQFEAYYNTVNCPNSPAVGCNVGFGIPGGAGYFLSNTFTTTGGGGFNDALNISLFRTEGLGASPWNNCDGTQPWDATPWNTTSVCLDQPGTGQGTDYYIGALGVSPVLASAPGTPCTTAGQCYLHPAADPIYEAGDSGTIGAGASVSDPTRLAGYYYAEVSKNAQTSATSPFNGTVGTGYGTLAFRPTTCTTGVGYWATDTGTWNTFNSQQGTLYFCSSTNTWSVKYTPYTYPHPLDTGGGGGGSTPPAPAPQGFVGVFKGSGVMKGSGQ
jgi:hypothetical protein